MTQAPIPAPEPAEEIVLMMEQLLYTHDGVTETISFMDGAGVLALFHELTGELPEGERGTEWYSEGYIWYDWQAVSVGMTAEEQSYAWVSVSAPEVGGVPVRTFEGVTVGMTRNEALASGAREGLDEGMDGTPDNMEVGRQEVPDATSYVNDGVGILFVALTMDGDTVRAMSTSGNDFRDI